MSLFVETRGAGPDLVLIHGWGLDGAVWGPVAERLAVRRRLWIVDLPGHGRSPPDAGGFTLEGAARAVAQAVPIGAAWLGWSLGALVAMTAALARAPMHLVLVGATPRFTRAPDWPHGVEPAVLEAFASDLARDPEATLQRFLALQTRGAEGARATLRALRAGALRRGVPHPQALRDGLAVLCASDLRARLADLAGPVAVIAGDRDTLVPAAASEALAAAVPHGRCTVIPGAGHVPFLSHPGSFVRALEDSLDG
ncbi:Pimeloyl-[acyl-carrier protein] methyl ester esterase [bacterium BMS3Bbin12]|nr:Pimeloyl-[acyl-carrier protein] methyl ester esterase [bacterium BMS3Bbin12]GBE50271.1 Pimeloyl-[acyl-carrier protein] methyl ester esterase [bacterium BMS3Bbin13]